MRISEVTVGVRDFTGKGPTITVRVSRPLRFRIWLALRLIEVAGWLACASTNVVEVD